MINELAAKIVQQKANDKFSVIFPDRTKASGQLDAQPRKEENWVQVAHVPATLAGWVEAK